MKKIRKISISLLVMFSILLVGLHIEHVFVYAATAKDVIRVASGEVGVSGKPNKYTYWNGAISGSYSNIKLCCSENLKGNNVRNKIFEIVQ